MLRQRFMTSAVLLSLILAAIFFLDEGWFALFIGAVVFLGAREWAALSGFTETVQRIAYALCAALCCFLLYVMPFLAWPLLLMAMLWWVVALVLVVQYPLNVAYWSAPKVRLGMGLLVLLPAWQGLVVIKEMPQANALILALMLLVWGADSGAYFWGRAFGRRKLAPRVSPGKSWAGVLGGLLVCSLFTLLLSNYQQWTFNQLLIALFVTVLIVLFSVVGDLTESMVKRYAGFKDSGTLLPGHGGILDRIDGLTAAIPMFAVWQHWIGWVHW